VLVPRSAKTPGVPDKGLAQHFATVPLVEVCGADQRFWKAKLGTLNRSCSTVLEKLKHIVKEPSIGVTQLCPVTQLCVMKFAQPNIVVLVGEQGSLMSIRLARNM